MNQDTQIVEGSEIDLMLPLRGGRKYLDMGRTPVALITIAWKWEDLGLIKTDDDGYISLTQRGLDTISNHNSSNQK